MTPQELVHHRKKAKELPDKREEGSILNQIWQVGSNAVKNILNFEDRTAQTLEKLKKTIQEWIVQSALKALSLFASLLFLILGVFFLAIDFGHIPRGIVFIGGGLLGFLILRFFTPATK